MSGKKNFLIAIPTYNEALNISRTVGAVLRLNPQVDVLVIDDNSPDGTADLVREMQNDFSGLHLLERPGKEGLGLAYKAAFAWGIERGYKWIGEFDADGSHRPEDLRRLLFAAQGFSDKFMSFSRDSEENRPDLVIGSRWVKDGKTSGWPFYRRLLSRAGSFYARTVLRLPVRDVTSGFRIYRRDFLERLRIEDIESIGYGFQIEMTLRSIQNGARIVEVPITFRERLKGQSKMSGSIIMESFVKVLQWGLGR